jgi:thioredoxin reductase (NADPH)
MLQFDHDREVDGAIVGGGPAGLTAAVYLARFLRSVLVFDAGAARAELIPSSHNCPGFPEGIRGVDLIDRLRTQAKGYGANIIRARVECVQRTDGSFTLSTASNSLQAAYVILATGILDKLPAIKGLKGAIAAGSVRLCPVCDAYEAKGRRNWVLGPGQAALNEALFLRSYSSRVFLLAYDPEDISEATRIEAEAAGIDIWEPVAEVVPSSPGLEIVMEGNSPRRTLDVVYPAMGCHVRSELGRHLDADCDDDGYLLVSPHLETSIPRLYAIGDVAKALNQIAVGFGHAALAATHINNSLRARGIRSQRAR